MTPRPTIHRLSLVAALAAGPLLAGPAGGCKSSDPAAKAPGPTDVAKTHRTPINLKSSWEKYALDNYRGVVRSQLNSTDPNLQFLVDPKVSAARNTLTGDTELMVIGEMEGNDAKGVRMRRPFTVVWRGAGMGWEVLNVLVGPGAVAPDPTIPPTPAPKKTSPTTGPTTPADPGAMAPGGPTPGGGTVTPTPAPPPP